MTVKPSGSSLSFGEDIVKEFGLPPGKNLGAYRLNGGITVSGLESLALDNEVNSVGIITPLMPREGTIKFSDFYGKKLNVVVDYTVATGYATRKDYSTARGKYNAGSNTTILGFALKDESPNNTKVWIHTNGDIGSDQAASGISTTYCSLLTGTWSATTDLRLDIGTSGAIYGAGGNGGKGGNTSGTSSSDGEEGKTGSSALGIQHTPIIITNRGSIVAGGGGGGGGGAGNGLVHQVIRTWWNPGGIGDAYNKYYFSAAGGGGGGGGRGLPAGDAGKGGSVALPGNRMDGSTLTKGNDGSDGTKSAGGKGGDNSSAENNGSSATGGVGGGGANNGSAGGSEGGEYNGTLSQGGSGSNGSDSSGKTGGLSGYSIIFLNNGTGVTINGNAVIGNTIIDTIPK